MRIRRLALLAALSWGVGGTAAAVEPGSAAPGDQLLDLGGASGSKEPVTITADRLEYDYKANVVVYRGRVEAMQGEASLKADTLTVRLRQGETGAVPTDRPAAPNGGGAKVQEIVAVGNVRIDQAARWATGGRAVFDQTRRTFVLTESPVMHDGPNEVAGDSITVFLDENRSVVDGGQTRRVKAVLHPAKGKEDAPAASARGTTETKVATP